MKPLALLITSLSWAACAAGTVTVDLYGGKAFNADADVSLREPAAGTDITLYDVRLEDKSLELPPYWGARLSYYAGAGLAVGVALDFVHAKAIADTGRVVYVRGRCHDEPVNGKFPLRRYVQRLELSHGNNLFLLEGIILYRPSKFSRRAELYGGGGAGPALLHAEVTTPTQETFEYQWDWCWGVLAGGRFWVWRRLALFGEYKYTRGDYILSLEDGAAEMTSAASHLTGGLTVKIL